MGARRDPRCNTANNPSCQNIIPRSLLNTPSALIAQKINKLFPDPNLPGLSNNYFASGGFTFNRHTIDSKVNWNVNAKLNVFGRFSFLHYADFTPTVFAHALLGPPTVVTINPSHSHCQTH